MGQETVVEVSFTCDRCRRGGRCGPWERPEGFVAGVAFSRVAFGRDWRDRPASLGENVELCDSCAPLWADFLAGKAVPAAPEGF